MDGGAWPFLVRGVICLLNCDNERDLGGLLREGATC